MGFGIPGRALENAQRDFVLSDIERDIHRKHMFPLTPARRAIGKACW